MAATSTLLSPPLAGFLQASHPLLRSVHLRQSACHWSCRRVLAKAPSADVGARCRPLGRGTRVREGVRPGAVTRRGRQAVGHTSLNAVCQTVRLERKQVVEGEQVARSAVGEQVLRAGEPSNEGQQLASEDGVVVAGLLGGKRVLRAAVTAVVSVAAALIIGGGGVGGSLPHAVAADALKTSACLLKECRGELVSCLEDPQCFANIVCLQTCNNRPDETECQIKCGDLLENKAVDKFNTCAVSCKKCVPQKPDENVFPVPSPSALVPSFDTRAFNGTWYITSGLNKTFDTFDCQRHEFRATEPGRFEASLKWRISTPDGGFFTRSAEQRFVQDKAQPALFLNHDNDFLHYRDDWYILAARTTGTPDDYIFVYYRGSNDAWDGYGGAVVYTRSSTLPPAIVPELQAAAAKVGLNFSQFTTTDNTCGPPAPLIARIASKLENAVEEVVEDIKEFAQYEEKVLEEEEMALVKTLSDDEKLVLDRLGMSAMEIEETFKDGLPFRKLR